MKRNTLLIISAILGSAYLIYLISYFAGGAGSTATVAIAATAIVMSHMICVFVAVVFSWIGWAMRKPWAALLAGGFYSLSIVSMFIYAPFVILQLIFCYIAFAQMKKN